MAVQRLAVGVGLSEAMLVGVVHPLLAFLDKFVQPLVVRPREVEVLVLNRLVLVLMDGAYPPFHRNARYTHYTCKHFGRPRGPVDLQLYSV